MFLFRRLQEMIPFPQRAQCYGFGAEVNRPMVKLLKLCYQHQALIDLWRPMLDGYGGLASRAESSRAEGARGLGKQGRAV